MKTMMITCPNGCFGEIKIEANNPLQTFDYMTNSNRHCKKCSSKLCFTDKTSFLAKLRDAEKRADIQPIVKRLKEKIDKMNQ